MEFLSTMVKNKLATSFYTGKTEDATSVETSNERIFKPILTLVGAFFDTGNGQRLATSLLRLSLFPIRII